MVEYSQNNIAPKTIHYCWFGRNPLPKMAVKCIESWRKYLPDYEIKEWNEDNFDVNAIPYTKEAYEAKKYAFVSDYARFWVLFHYGGVYFDTDVEAVKPMKEILEHGPFMGCETDGASSDNSIAVAAGLGLYALPGMAIYADILSFYGNLHFRREDGSLDTTTVVNYVTDLLLAKGLEQRSGIQNVCGVTIYPKEYFCPKSFETGELNMTNNTYLIHHYSSSWHSRKERVEIFMRKYFPRLLDFYIYLKTRIH